MINRIITKKLIIERRRARFYQVRKDPLPYRRKKDESKYKSATAKVKYMGGKLFVTDFISSIQEVKRNKELSDVIQVFHETNGDDLAMEWAFKSCQLLTGFGMQCNDNRVLIAESIQAIINLFYMLVVL